MLDFTKDGAEWKWWTGRNILMGMSKSLTHRPTNFGSGPVPDDYQIREDGRTVGRIYKAINVTKDPWVWFINGEGFRADKGSAATFEDALAGFKRAWERS